MNSTLINSKTKNFNLNMNTVMSVVSDMRKLSEKVSNESEYVAFVGEWKLLYKDMTEVTRAARVARLLSKSTMNSEGVVSAHSARQVIRGYNRFMSELRVDMKVKLKEGSFPAVEKTPELA